jgi:hypothetical protein
MYQQTSALPSSLPICTKFKKIISFDALPFLSSSSLSFLYNDVADNVIQTGRAFSAKVSANNMTTAKINLRLNMSRKKKKLHFEISYV